MRIYLPDPTCQNLQQHIIWGTADLFWCQAYVSSTVAGSAGNSCFGKLLFNKFHAIHKHIIMSSRMGYEQHFHTNRWKSATATDYKSLSAAPGPAADPTSFNLLVVYVACWYEIRTGDRQEIRSRAESSDEQRFEFLHIRSMEVLPTNMPKKKHECIETEAMFLRQVNDIGTSGCVAGSR